MAEETPPVADDAGSGAAARLISRTLRQSRQAAVAMGGAVAGLEELGRHLHELPIDRAVDLLAHAPSLWVAGARRAFPVATYLAYALQLNACDRAPAWRHGLVYSAAVVMLILALAEMVYVLSFWITGAQSGLAPGWSSRTSTSWSRCSSG